MVAGRLAQPLTMRRSDSNALRYIFTHVQLHLCKYMFAVCPIVWLPLRADFLARSLARTVFGRTKAGMFVESCVPTPGRDPPPLPLFFRSPPLAPLPVGGTLRAVAQERARETNKWNDSRTRSLSKHFGSSWRVRAPVSVRLQKASPFPSLGLQGGLGRNMACSVRQR